MGVFATRSPFRPNPIGLSCVKLEAVLPEGTALLVSGADLMDGTPILDIKPYVPYADCHPEALEGFTGTAQMRRLEVQIPPALLAVVPAQSQAALLGVLSQDPRARLPERSGAALWPLLRRMRHPLPGARRGADRVPDFPESGKQRLLTAPNSGPFCRFRLPLPHIDKRTGL